MNKKLLVIKILTLAILICSASAQAAPNALECSALLSQASTVSGSATEIFLNLFRALAKNKNAFSASDLKSILSHATPVNPFEVVTPNLKSEETYAFQRAFEKLLKNQEAVPIDWEKIKAEIKKLVIEQEVSEGRRAEARNNTKAILAPIFLGESHYKAGKGSVRYTFSLADGTRMAVVWDHDKTYLVDLQSQKRNLMGTRWDVGDGINHYDLKSGGTFISIANNAGELSFYKVTPKHKLKLIKDKFKGVIPEGKPTRTDLRRSHLTESLRGKPSVIERLVVQNRLNQVDVLVGFLEIEIETGNQRFYPVEKGRKLEVAKNGHVVSYEIKDKRTIVVRDLSTDSTLTEFPIPEGFLESNKARFSRKETGLIKEDLLLQNLSHQWIDIESGSMLDLNNRFEELPLLLGHIDGKYKIIEAPTKAKAVWLYDEMTGEISEIPLLVEIGSTPSRLLKLPGGEQILFIGSGRGDEKSGFILSLRPKSDEEFLKLDLRSFGVKRFVDAYVTPDGRIEGIFATDSGFKIIQLFGPVTGRDGAIE